MGTESPWQKGALALAGTHLSSRPAVSVQASQWLPVGRAFLGTLCRWNDKVVWEDLGHGWKQIVGVRALSRQVGGQTWGRGQQRARFRLSSGHLWRSAPSGEPVVSPACFAHRAQRQGRLEVETWGETLGHTREEEMPDADPERLHVVSLTRKPGNGKTLAAFEVEE